MPQATAVAVFADLAIIGSMVISRSLCPSRRRRSPAIAEFSSRIFEVEKAEGLFGGDADRRGRFRAG